MKRILLLHVCHVAVCVLVGFTGCAWLKPPIDGGGSTFGANDREDWGYPWSFRGQESREYMRSSDFHRWANQILRDSQHSSSGASRRGR